MVVSSKIHVKSTYQASVQDTGPNTHTHTPVQDDIALHTHTCKEQFHFQN
jgi:hypothetical protein